jgi:nucleotide-binding universal stress UspA family protein
MGTRPVSRSTYLALDQLTANPGLARRLPAELARRFHALPLAEDNGRVTVVMADPANAEARDAVVTALGPASCVVQGDATAIDALLSSIWTSEASQPLKFLLCSFRGPLSREVEGYAQAMGELLGAHIERLAVAGSMNALAEGHIDHDLIIFAEAEYPAIRRLLVRPVQQEPASRSNALPPGILIAQQPRWPLQRILLVAQGEMGDDAALDWVLHLARAAGSEVTVLVVVPPVPGMYGSRGCLAGGLPDLLSADTPLGQELCRLSRRLVDWDVAGTLRLRQGVPEWQIAREASEGQYDMVVLAATSCTWWRRCLEGDIVGPLLRQVGRPLLVTKPRIT